MKYHSHDRPVGVTHRLYEQQPQSRLGIRLSLSAYCAAKAVVSFTISSLGKMRVTAHRLRQGAGSFCRHGNTAGRSW